ncbi:MAG: hypothetical protein JXQ83_08415 [Candidatus Glassbacteria bacterium]|nr:hypothetical protein [Candidatus Glassbacteria bacterium]
MRSATLVRWSARILALVWAGFWTWFGLASGLGEGLDPLGVFMHTLLPGLVFLAAALAAWRWEAAGSAGLLLMAVLALVQFPFARQSFGLATITLPPVIAAVLFILGRWLSRRPCVERGGQGEKPPATENSC